MCDGKKQFKESAARLQHGWRHWGVDTRSVEHAQEHDGAGLITGASDDDPSGIGTYSQTGAQFGYAQVWLALFSFPLMAAVQEICARIGLHTGAGLAETIRKN